MSSTTNTEVCPKKKQFFCEVCKCTMLVSSRARHFKTKKHGNNAARTVGSPAQAYEVVMATVIEPVAQAYEIVMATVIEPVAEEKNIVEKPVAEEKEPREIIIRAWGEYDSYMDIVLFQNDKQLYDNVENWVLKNKNKKYIYDGLVISLFQKYTDEIIDKYGPEPFMEGLKNIMEDIIKTVNSQDYGERKYISTYKTKDFTLKKGVLKEKNRKKLFAVNACARP